MLKAAKQIRFFGGRDKMDTLKAEKRSMDVKAKKLRREGYVIGNMFGREIEQSVPVKMNQKDVDTFLKKDNKGSQIMLEVDGKPYDVLVKEIVFNPLTKKIDNIDFQALVSNEMVHSVAEVILLNHDKVQQGVLQESLTEVAFKALPKALVDKIKIDVGEMKVGDTICVKDLDIASNPDIKLITDPETVVVTVTAVHNEVPDADAEETEDAETAE